MENILRLESHLAEEYMNRGFTLIELLIVVAIIAIVAAIAVPNFLEAQTRSKVSRVKAELATLATALETYTVDTNRWPFDGHPAEPHYGWVNAWSQATTPIPYITQIQEDPFQDPTFPDTNRPDHTHYTNKEKGHHAYDYGTAYWHDAKSLPPNPARGYTKHFGMSPWKIGSAGPDLRFENDGSFYGMNELYDPTNGTVSEGDIYRSRKGQH